MIVGNFIGTNVAGTAALGNTDDGIAVDSGESATRSAARPSGAGNVVSGNGGDGVSLDGSGSSSGLGRALLRQLPGRHQPRRFAFGSVNSDTQLSYEMFTAYTNTDLYIGFRVSDNIVVAKPNTASPI